MTMEALISDRILCSGKCFIEGFEEEGDLRVKSSDHVLLSHLKSLGGCYVVREVGRYIHCLG